MLEDLLLRKRGYSRSLPFFGPVLDGLDDWLVRCGYALSTRRCYLSVIGCVDRYLQDHCRCKLHELTVGDWETCRRWFVVRDSRSARVVTTMRRYLEESGNIAPSWPEDRDPLRTWVDRYADYLRKVRGFEPKTIRAHSFTTTRFVNHLSCAADGFALTEIKSTEIERFIDAGSSIRSRATMQHVVAHVRGFLRFLELSEHLPPTRS